MYATTVLSTKAVVESQVTAFSYEDPVVADTIYVIPGQEVFPGDTLFKVKRPELIYKLEEVRTSLKKTLAEIDQTRYEADSKLQLLQIEIVSKIENLKIELSEISARIEQLQQAKNAVKSILGNAGEGYDLIKLKNNQMIKEKELQQLRDYLAKEKEQIKFLAQEKLKVLALEKQLKEREINTLEDQSSSLVKTISFRGIVNEVNVQLDELAPPYKTLLSVTEYRPSIIKAFIKEQNTQPVAPGDTVLVSSENRAYSIKGTVLELGARITTYPTKIQPDPQTPAYGQEIFIKISPENRFLNGERVFVYQNTEEPI